MKEKVQEVLNDKEAVQMLHQTFSAHTFNECWKYIEKKERTEEDIENMLILANTSLWHWKKRDDCKAQNLSIAYWQLGRVHSLIQDYEKTKYFGQKCLKISQDAKLDPFYIGYAYEVLITAALLNKNKARASELMKRAEMHCSQISNEKNKSYLNS